ncbi:MAG: tripartite tricarboxylate transporter substrate binding protein [Polaromonas sp.]
MNPIPKVMAFLLTGLLAGLFSTWVQAQPAANLDGPIKLIVPFAPGGGVDTAARLIARQLQVNTGVTVIVENRAGASGTVGGKVVQMAAPDGQTLLFSASTHVLVKEVLKVPPYDPVTDFAAVARVAEAPLMMVIAPTLPQRSAKEVLDAARQNPDKWTAALPALGAASHVGTLMLAQQGNVKFTTAAYRGTAPALTDVAGGHSQILMDSIIALLPMAKEGRVRPIAVTSAKRVGIAPDVPTAAESGFPNMVYNSWYGVWAPKATPAAKVKSLNEAFNVAVKDLARAGTLSPLGILPVIEDVAQFRQFIDQDIKRSTELLRSSGFKAE